MSKSKSIEIVKGENTEIANGENVVMDLETARRVLRDAQEKAKTANPWNFRLADDAPAFSTFVSKMRKIAGWKLDGAGAHGVKFAFPTATEADIAQGALLADFTETSKKDPGRYAQYCALYRACVEAGMTEAKLGEQGFDGPRKARLAIDNLGMVGLISDWGDLPRPKVEKVATVRAKGTPDRDLAGMIAGWRMVGLSDTEIATRLDKLAGL